MPLEIIVLHSQPLRPVTSVPSRPRVVELASRQPILQIALDLTSLEDALLLASRLRRGLGDSGWLAEAGTPLIKSEGLRSVSLLARVVDPVPVVADMKTADTGALEAELACKAGASVVTVLGLAPDETIEAAVRTAHNCGMAVAVDMLGVRNVLERVEELEPLGVDIIELHVGIDVQRALGLTAAELRGLVSKIASKFNGVVAVAGGLNESTAPAMIEAGASIAIVGGAITRSRDPVGMAKKILKAIQSVSR
ncbi:hexulose-6-phosphate synthase [Hyperthermus butylicus DSM 5456]|uniref:Hexulose-6-phosphate synthase n=1 Tax=Hyperthermus butylicus (strain DSM 5456 / JCM 9403 / PLM1-5) TaxID=415426 RepID=A2BJ43_HYPBU|nr:hexulose-6-phosphate synthase [Hyperthermus butylicus DSM 5456]